ncbi:Hypothetical predicted protein [Olea europaea subsp. europaea]|uniref:Uncharacterized protein n=1 Tax=Olea europaea subsp. europaea TaxID=158383 RepID=A0A8S0PUU0_OLEEU|nr:Hypothetical predicted protein [Olea europaea subsp. europaea]
MAMVGTEPDFQATLGNFWDTMCRKFLDTVCRPSPGRVLATIRMQPIFLTFVVSLWARPCLGRVMAKAGTEPDFQAILGSFMDTVCKPCPGCGRDVSRLSGIFRQFLEHDVQAMFGMRLVRDRDATWFSGSFWNTACRPYLGCCKVTS